MGTDFERVILDEYFWLFYVYQVAMNSVVFSTELVFISQICEWIVMVYILQY